MTHFPHSVVRQRALEQVQASTCDTLIDGLVVKSGWRFLFAIFRTVFAPAKTSYVHLAKISIVDPFLGCGYRNWSIYDNKTSQCDLCIRNLRYESKTSSHSTKMANLHKTHQSRTKLTTGKAMESHNSKDSLSKYTPWAVWSPLILFGVHSLTPLCFVRTQAFGASM